MSVIKKERECSGYSNVVSGTGDIVERIIKRRASRELPVRDTLVLCDWEPYNPVGRNKLPKKSKREQKILERLIITKAIVSKKKLFIRKKKQLRQV